VAGGQVLWVVATTIRDMAPPWLEPGRRRFTQQALVFGASVAIFAAAAWRLSPGPLYPGGDEPHYLVVTQSLLTDHDLAIANNHARGDYLAYLPGAVEPDYRATGRNGVIYIDSPGRHLRAGLRQPSRSGAIAAPACSSPARGRGGHADLARRRARDGLGERGHCRVARGRDERAVPAPQLCDLPRVRAASP
jgi:hypothetical protein